MKYGIIIYVFFLRHLNKATPVPCIGVKSGTCHYNYIIITVDNCHSLWQQQLDFMLLFIHPIIYWIFKSFHYFSFACSTFVSAFYWLAVYFRKSWTPISIYVLLFSCYAGEVLGHLLSDSGYDNYINQPVRIFAELLAVCIACLSSSLETGSSLFIIWFCGITRYLACVVLTIIPQMLRPMIAYFCGVIGVIMAKYTETAFQSVPNVCFTQDSRFPAIKRRRSTSAAGCSTCALSQKHGRRTSLPTMSMTLKSLVRIKF